MPDITGIVLDCEGMDFIDSQGSTKMREILELAEQAHVTLRLARVKPPVLEMLRRDDVLGSHRCGTGFTGMSTRQFARKCPR